MAVRDPATEWVRVQMYRRMTPAERMEIAAQMYDDADRAGVVIPPLSDS